MNDALKDLALNLWSTWNHSTDKIWSQLNPELWKWTHNPWAILKTTSDEKLKGFFSDPNFSALVDNLMKARHEALNSETWFDKSEFKKTLSCIAYFSMEFMLTEALPIYSGGLGNVAGDQLKAASDLGIPVIGIGLLYSQGYFRQFIDKNGEQQELYPYNEPGQLPIRPLRLENGEWLRIKVELPGWSLWLRTWEVTVGRRKLYLLDSNDLENFPDHQSVTNELYGGDMEQRLKQEIVLAVGGWQLLQALGLEPEVCHLNEGHAAFVVLERALSFMKKTGQPFDVALSATRAGNLFTTHTAEPTGFDWFSPELMEKYFGQYAEQKLGIPFEKLLAMGQMKPDDYFNVAYLAIRGSGFVNGVSRLHGEVSRHLFKDLFPDYPEEEIPVGSVTNGVHMPSWDSMEADEIWTDACGKERWHGETEGLEDKIRAVPDSRIWDMRNRARGALVNYSRARLARQLEDRGDAEDEIEKARSYLNPDVLTLGFARRFTGYKRPDFLLYDEERLLKLLTASERPIQLIIAGKAHPADSEGHDFIKKWMQFIMRHEVRPHAIFLSDYDMILTEHLVQGVDLWVNTPRRPWEACGTSGMKVLVNGGLNISELDGWWVEAYKPGLGWAIGDGQEHGEDPDWDEAEAKTFYDILESEIIPQFYSRDERNIPGEWLTKIRESMARLTPYFASNRTVREYTEDFYLPAANLYRKRSENNGALAKHIVEWQHALEKNWSKLGFGEANVKGNQLEIHVYLNDLDYSAVKVELYSSGVAKELEYKGRLANSRDGHIYQIEIPQGLTFSLRIIPRFQDVSIPLETHQILWKSL